MSYLVSHKTRPEYRTQGRLVAEGGKMGFTDIKLKAGNQRAKIRKTSYFTVYIHQIREFNVISNHTNKCFLAEMLWYTHC